MSERDIEIKVSRNILHRILVWLDSERETESDECNYQNLDEMIAELETAMEKYDLANPREVPVRYVGGRCACVISKVIDED